MDLRYRYDGSKVAVASFAPPGLGFMRAIFAHGLRRGLRILRRFAAISTLELP